VWGTGGVVSLFSPILFVTLGRGDQRDQPALDGFFSRRPGPQRSSRAPRWLAAWGSRRSRLGDDSWNLLGDRSIFVAAYLVGSVLALFAVSALGSRFSHGLRSITGMHSEILENIAEGSWPSIGKAEWSS
jgi:hypothetical protein